VAVAVAAEVVAVPWEPAQKSIRYGCSSSLYLDSAACDDREINILPAERVVRCSLSAVPFPERLAPVLSMH
jgi:hypothetical protein